METEKRATLTPEEIYKAERRWWDKYALRVEYDDNLNEYLHAVARKKAVGAQGDECELF